MALAIEAFASQDHVGNLSSATVALNTLGTNRVVLLLVHTDGHSSVRRSVTGVSDTNGLTWALYTTQDWDSSDATHKQRMEVWWAFAAAQQTANTVTVTLSGASNGPDLVTGSIAGVDPSRFALPFDADVSLPQKINNPTSTQSSSSTTFSTHDAHTAVFNFYCANLSVANQPSGTPAGWTSLASLTTSGTERLITYVYGRVFSAQQVNTVVSPGALLADFGVIDFAIGGDTINPRSFGNCAGF